ncbi:MAG: DUF126 domain-containing protein [Candidatus Diapherotrites archaeon]|uniref:Phosphomevalonate dehydratase small subunit n=1 Tax=Candidatus Iainarchaeum sp. TaxID=3101447 RepID=A0A497JFP4_9ARCH|nr:DUF126 domain-containing protein [Candidatus Diapherotrites archaeon]RLG69675.1 MAG: hypothetical protein DRO07_01850 [Candidatus Diapherotrites archaeon]
MILRGRKIFSGKVSGIAMISEQPISFYGGVDPKTGIVVEKGHSLEGKSIAGKILVFPSGKGSTVGSYTIYRLKKNGKAPKAMVLKECEAIVAVGAILAEIPCVDKIKIEKIKDGSTIEVNADKAEVRI